MEKQITLHKNWIDDAALNIVENLKKSNFTTYFVGGCVRDLLQGLKPKDFDIATMAIPQEIKKNIHNSYIIGKRFRLVLVRRKDSLYEVATFRKTLPKEIITEEASEDEDETDTEDIDDNTESNKPIGDNLFGTPEEDANRRDFTINGLFYDPFTEELIDYLDGLNDLENHILRMIGNPHERLEEDSIRILRALRIAKKLNFSIEPSLKVAIQDKAHLLTDAVLPRKREEIIKFLRLKKPSLIFVEAYDLNVLQNISPKISECFHNKDSRYIFNFYINKTNELGPFQEDPLFLFSLLMLGYLRATEYKNPKDLIRANDILNNKNIMSIMNSELGMFKYEQDIFSRAIQLYSSLSRRKQLEAKGEKAVITILKNEAFPLALKLASIENAISSDDIYYWQNMYIELFPKLLVNERRSRPHARKHKSKS